MRVPTGSASENKASIDLQLAALASLPTPVLVLSSQRIIIFTNRAAQRILGSPFTKHPDPGIAGQTPSDAGIKLLYNREWTVVLDKLLADDKSSRSAREAGSNGLVHEADAVITGSHLKFEERYFRILISVLEGVDGCQFVLSVEKLPHVEKSFTPRSEPPSSSRKDDLTVTLRATTDCSLAESSRDIARIKRAVFDSSNVAGFILTADEKFYLTNKKTREILGDVMGGAEGCDGLSLRNRLEIWDEKFTRRLDPSEFPGMKLVRAKEPFLNYRCGFTHSVTGEKIGMNVNGECLYDDDTGDFMGGILWCRDLQEYGDFLAKEQQQRIESHETTCNLMPHLVWTATAEGYVDWFSERWYEFTGLTREESVGDGFKQVIHEEDLAKLLKKWEFHTREGNECDVEIRYRRHDGVYKWMLARACPLKDDKGNILKWYGTNTDIHDLVMARIEASRNKLQMLTVLAHAEVNLFSINKDRRMTMAEGGMLWDIDTQEYDVHSKSSLLGKDAIEIAQHTQPGGVPGYEQNVLDVLSGKLSVAQSEDKIGERIYRTRVVAELEHDVADGGQEPEVIGVLGLAIDVTDMKARASLQVDNTRLMMEEQAAKDSNKMKSQFLANMSHEMRTPTAGVIGMVELLGEDPTLSTEQREYVNSIQLSAKALLTIVNDILDFSKIESGRFDIEEVPFNLSSIVGELCKMLGMFAVQKGLDFVYKYHANEDMEVLGDPGRIRQILSNLLTNALKFTKEGSVSLTVTTNPVVGERQDIVEFQFMIVDTGIGIARDVLDKLFQPFSQGDSSTARLYGGTGLGLTISKNLANLMHGSIRLESTPNQGSKATFTVPFKVSSRVHTPNQHSLSPSPNLGFRSSSTTWTQPLAHRSINQDLLNQQISASVTNNFSSFSRPGSSSRRPSIDGSFVLQIRSLTPEERKEIHVLVVEDNPINQTIAIKNIRKLGFSVTAVWNGREALSYLLNPSPTQPCPSIILMDVQMPVMDGYEATRVLRTKKDYAIAIDTCHSLRLESGKHVSTSPGSPASPRTMNFEDSTGTATEVEEDRKVLLRDIPVIAMTASAIQGDREKCYEAGMDDYLAKPVERASLEKMLVKWACRRREG